MIRAVNLGEVADFINGFAFKPEDWGSEGLPIIRIQDLTGSGKEGNKTIRKISERYLVRAGDLLVSWSASLGVYQWAGAEALVNQHIFKVVPDLSKVDKDYLRHALDASIHKMDQFTHGSTMKHINRKEFLDHAIPLPPLDEQRRIAAILDKADALRRKRKRALDLLDSLTQSIFFDLFGYTSNEVSRWGDPIPLADLADIGSGITKGRQLNGRKMREVPYLAVANVQDRKLDLSTVKSIEASEEEISRYRLRDGDLLLTEGGDPDKLGRGTLWAGELPEAIHQNHIFRVRVTSDSILPLFLNWLVSSPYGKRYFLSVAKQTTGIASINKTQLSEFPTVVPPIGMQQRFVDLVNATASKAKCAASSGDSINALFASLQHSAFSGQL